MWGVQKLALLSQGGTNFEVLFTIQSPPRDQAEAGPWLRLPPASVPPLPHPTSLIPCLLRAPFQYITCI